MSKRQAVDVHFTNKKIKYSLEDLANEILYEIFVYLNHFHIWKGFFDLNQRFDDFLISLKLTDRVHTSSSMSKSDFDYYHEKLVSPNMNQIKSLHLANLFIVNEMFSPPQLINKYVQLECLILDQINIRKLGAVLRLAQKLVNLRRLSVHLIDCADDLGRIFEYVLKLKKIQSFEINYQTPSSNFTSSAFVDLRSSSSIEILTINGRFSCDSLDGLLSNCPRLRQLTIHELVRGDYSNEDFTTCHLKQLESISFTLNNIDMHYLQMLIEKFFRHIQILQLTMSYYNIYRYTGIWERLITNFLPYLRVFDIRISDLMCNLQMLQDKALEQFQSSFWIENQWYFDWFLQPSKKIFYSTNPYRRKDYMVPLGHDKKSYKNIPEINLNVAQHIVIHGSKETNDFVNYFPKTTKLTLVNRAKSMSTIHNHVVNLNRLTELSIKFTDVSLDDILDLLIHTPNLYSLNMDQLTIESDENNRKFRYVATHNRLRKIDINSVKTLGDMELILRLFPKLEHLKTGLNNRQDGICIYFFMKDLFFGSSNDPHLVFLCLKKLQKSHFTDLKICLSRAVFSVNYTMQYIGEDLCVWL